MARTFFSKEQNKWVSVLNHNEHYALAFDAITNEPIFEGDLVYAEKLSHGVWEQLSFFCCEYSGNKANFHYVKNVIAVQKYAYHYVNGIPHHFLPHSLTIRYFKIK